MKLLLVVIGVIVKTIRRVVERLRLLKLQSRTQSPGETLNAIFPKIVGFHSIRGSKWLVESFRERLILVLLTVKKTFFVLLLFLFFSQ